MALTKDNFWSAISKFHFRRIYSSPPAGAGLLACKERIAALAVSAALLIGQFPAAAAHEARIPVVIDTDAALDDMRSIILLLQDGHFDIRAVVTSDGACSPSAGAGNIQKVLIFMGRGSIPVGEGRDLGLPSPPWRSMSESIGGAGLESSAQRIKPRGAAEIIVDEVTAAGTNVTYVCLGPMTNLADALRQDATLANRISTVYYSGSLPDAGIVVAGTEAGEGASWNTARDEASALAVAGSGLKIYCCSIPDSLLLPFDKELFGRITAFENAGAGLVERMHCGGRAEELLLAGHFFAWDETAALCMIEPLLSEFESQAGPDGSEKIFRLASFHLKGARDIYIGNFERGGSSPAQERETVVFETFPSGPELIRSDIREIIPELIERHGFEEWRAAVLANELHRHLGIYSILGVKMGLRAREILGATLDELEIVSRAGLSPPLSCLNDGLQVSTGASLGRGSIRIEKDFAAPEAVFIMGERRIALRLKSEVAARIGRDIENAVESHGNLTPRYYAEIRRLSLVYWLEMDRAEIFETVRE